MDCLVELDAKITKLEDKIDNIIRYGIITEIDYAKGCAKVDLQNGIISPYIPYLQVPNIFTPLKIGNQVVVMSPYGALERGLIIPQVYLSGASLGSSENEFIIKLNDGEIKYDGSTLTIKGNTKIILQDETGGGLVCQNNLCSFSGAFHPEGSKKIKGSL